MKRLPLVILCVLFTACGGSSPSSPSSVPSPTPAPAPAPAPTPQPASLTGTVTVTNTSVRISGVTVKFLDGPNAGQTTTTDSTGTYRFTGIQAGNTNLSAGAPDWVESRLGIGLNGPSTLNFTILTVNPWRKIGGGNDVWTRPLWVSRVQIHGVYTGSSSNFVIWCGTQLVVNEIIGTFGGRSTTYDGTHQLSTGCASDMRTESSNGVSWSLTEVR